ncbi:thioredoxin-like domain-containing protein [Rugosimonospora acidiphila]|uniref:Thioredoxin-like domain-containing protein n=1 Tax=Rugosimonospora acidiphila TaxID=556531 RepID=A0ABP9RFZ2_9ACTN
MIRVRAPELRGRGWLNTGGRELRLSDLRGKIVLLDFWTFCCINCLHVLDELRPLEEKYGDILVTIGVHSPKFEHEKDPVALAAAVERYGVGHPVLDDPELETWQQYTARAWPTLCLVDPEGYLVATVAGEGHAAGLAKMIDSLIETHEARGTLHRGDAPFVPPAPPDTDLRFPGKAVLSPDGGFLVSSSAQHQIVELAEDFSVLRRIGSGTRGRADGVAATAQFSEPQGLCLLPARVAEAVGYDLVVADTVNHLLRGVRLADGSVSTVAGTGRPWRSAPEGTGALDVDLSSPWDLAWYDGRVIVAMAGVHQLWWFDPIEGTAGVYAGTTVEALRDGPLAETWMAQPSGLSALPGAAGSAGSGSAGSAESGAAGSVESGAAGAGDAAGERLWLVDSESSSLRFVADGALHTAVGQGLFDFGQVDGPAAKALFQHPLGVCALPDGSVLVADTYNNALRRFADGQVSTVATGLAEPSDVVLTPDGGVVVVESAAHRLTRLAPGVLAVAADGSAGGMGPDRRYRTERPATRLAPGTVRLEVMFAPAPGQKLDDSFGPSTRLEVSASPPELLLAGAGVTTDLTRELVLSPDVPGGVLQVVGQAATCDAHEEHAACHLTRQDWGVPVVTAPDGAATISLALFQHDQPAG